MNKQFFLILVKIAIISIMSLILFFIIGAIVGGIIGTILTAFSLKQAVEGMRGDQGLGLVALLMFYATIAGGISGVLFSLLGQTFVSRRLAKKYGSTLGSHPALKITFLTWGIIIAAIFLLKFLAG